MKIIQLLPSLNYGDAVGNEVLIIEKLILKMGYETGIFYDNAKDEVKDRGKHYSKLPELEKNDIILYHMATPSDFSYFLEDMKCYKIMIYHNITPPEYYKNYDDLAYLNCKKGIVEVKYLSDKIDYCLADSEFNKKDLIKMGYKCKIDVLPIILSLKDYLKKPSKKIIKKYLNKNISILSLGRIDAVNKKWENIIKTFYYYQKYINAEAKLFLVGSYNNEGLYYKQLCNYIKALGVKNIIFTGHISFNEIIAYYKLADVYLCMSEHEGFCVPLVEAMFFQKPIVAYAKTAIPDTMDYAGFLLENNDPLEAAFIIDKILKDNVLRDNIIKNQDQRLLSLNEENVSNMFVKYIDEFIRHNNG